MGKQISALILSIKNVMKNVLKELTPTKKENVYLAKKNAQNANLLLIVKNVINHLFYFQMDPVKKNALTNSSNFAKAIILNAKNVIHPAGAVPDLPIKIVKNVIDPIITKLVML